MDGRTPMNSADVVPRSSRLWSAAAVCFLILLPILALPGCGQPMDTQLPDLATRKNPPSGQQPMTAAEQKRAIDAMIAKRDGKEPEAK